MGEVLIQIWLKSISELLDKQVNVQKESLKKTSVVHENSHKPTKKCAMKMKEERKKQLPRKNFCGERKDFIRPYQKNG